MLGNKNSEHLVGIQRLVGKLNYLPLTQPNITYAISVVNDRYNSLPTNHNIYPHSPNVHHPLMRTTLRGSYTFHPTREQGPRLVQSVGFVRF